MVKFTELLLNFKNELAESDLNTLFSKYIIPIIHHKFFIYCLGNSEKINEIRNLASKMNILSGIPEADIYDKIIELCNETKINPQELSENEIENIVFNMEILNFWKRVFKLKNHTLFNEQEMKLFNENDRKDIINRAFREI